jgi:hypothetical protein
MQDPHSGDADDPQKIDRVSSTTPTAVREGERVGRATDTRALDATRSVHSARAVTRAGRTTEIARLRAALAAGEIPTTRARAALIDEVVRAQLPAHAGPELVDRIRQQVNALLENDPTLQRLLRRP